jgi:hypothetical protein
MPASIFRFLYENPANYLGRKAGLIEEDDGLTSVSFGFMADAFSAFGWPGAAAIPLALGICFFGLNRWMVGPLPGNVWCAFLFAAYQHEFAEFSASSLFSYVTYHNLWTFAVFGLMHLAALVSAPWLRLPVAAAPAVPDGMPAAPDAQPTR